VGKFTNSDDEVQAKIYDLYLRNTRFINSWDLVDVSAPVIVGGYLEDKDREVLERLARSNDLWERRIAVISTFAFIKRGHVSETLKISRILLSDTEDLIHKAVGWMLREVGKQDPKAALKFLSRYHTFMPRTMLRYAIERLPEAQRRSYLKR
jgi:3-methyladenine DNA glycosylase AlkD